MSRVPLALLVGALFLPAVSAQPVTVDPAALDALFSKAPKVEVNLNGSLLRMAAMGSADDPETADLIRALRSITVRVYDLEDALGGLDERLTAFGRQLESEGWQTLVRVRPSEDDTDDVWIYVRDAGDAFDGMAVMSLDNDSGEASFVFIDGPIDPSQLGRLGGRFGGVHIDHEDVHPDVEFSDEELDRIEEEAERSAEQAEADAERAVEEAERAAEEAERAAEEAQRAADEAERARAEAARATRPR